MASAMNTMVWMCVITLLCMNCIDVINASSLSDKQELLQKLTNCAQEILDTVDTEITNIVFSVEELNRTLEDLETATQEEVSIYQDILDKLMPTDNSDKKSNSLVLQELETQLIKAESGSSEIAQTCSRRNSDGIVNDNGGNWLPQPNIGSPNYYNVRRAPKPTGELGATVISRFDVCYDESFCNIQGIAVLADGLVAFPDSDTFEIRVYSIDGSLIRKISTVPLAPLSITHLEGYTVLCRVKTLSQKTNAIMKIDLWTGKSNIIIDLGTFNWEFACLGDIGVIYPTMFIPCEPYMFMVHVNGTLIRRIRSVPNSSGIASVFNTEAGANQTALGGRTFPGITASYSEISLFDQNFVEICRFSSNRKGAVGKNGIIYAVQGEDKIIEYDSQCKSKGLLATSKKGRRINNLAVSDNILYATTTRYKRFRHNHFVTVVKIP